MPVTPPVDALEGTDDVTDEVSQDRPPVRRPSVAKPLTAQERSQARAESKANARTKKTEKPERSGGGLASRVVSTERTAGVRKFFRETSAEIKKVNWPDRETTRNLTYVVIAISVALGLLLGGLDYVLFQIFEALP